MQNTTVSNNSKSEELTLEKIQEAIKIIEDLPPYPVSLKCSFKTFEALKEGTHELITSGLLGALGLKVEIDNDIEDDNAEVEYSDGRVEKLKEDF